MFDEIRPYNDQEAVVALKRASNNPLMERISAFLFPGKDPDILRNTLNTVSGVDDFQTRVMYPAVRSIINKTTKGLTFEGLKYFLEGGAYTMLSAHRDIVLDSAFIQYILKDNGLPLTEIAVGDNLISQQFVEDLMRSNRMIKVVRSSNPREVYTTSKVLSEYIRGRVSCDNPASVWIAHRNGRTKNGWDETEQGLVKMLSMSGPADFVENLSQMKLMPVALSYEIESCGVQKAFETYVKAATGQYVKRPGEDIQSIISGIVQQKGRVHITFCEPIRREELEQCSALDKNERFRALAEIVDKRIVAGTRIWPVNIAAAEILAGKSPSDKAVTAEFQKYLCREMKTLPLHNKTKEVKENLVKIYAAPAIRKGLV